MTTSMSRMKVAARTPTAAGGSGLRMLPRGAWFLIMRTIPAFHIAALAAAQQVAGLSEEHLRFTSEEVQALIQLRNRLAVPDDEAEQLVSNTEGWITGILLTTQLMWQGLIASLVTLPFRFFGVLCGALLLCILIECVGMHFFWPDQGWRHAQGMLHYELDQLSTHFTRSALVQEPGRTAHRLVEQGYDWLFVKSGLLDWIRDASAQASAGSHRPTKDFRYYIGLVYVNVESYLIAAAYTTLVFLVRLLVLCLTLPLFLMAAFVGLVDGLVRRDIRRFGAGRESGFIYHRARASLIPLAVLPWVTYLALPVSVNPLLILLPSAALLGVAVCRSLVCHATG